MLFYHISERSMLIFLNLSAHLKSIQHNVAFLGTQPFWCGLACPLVRLPALCFSMHPLPIQWPCGKSILVHQLFYLSSKYNSVVLVQWMYQISWRSQNLFIRQYRWTVQLCGLSHSHGLWSHSSEGPLKSLKGGHASYLPRLPVHILFFCPIC